MSMGFWADKCVFSIYLMDNVGGAWRYKEDAKCPYEENRKNISHEKHYSLYPTVMIERLGIDVHFQKLHIGTEMLIFIKACFLDLLNKTGCRFIL